MRLKKINKIEKLLNILEKKIDGLDIGFLIKKDVENEILKLNEENQKKRIKIKIKNNGQSYLIGKDIISLSISQWLKVEEKKVLSVQKNYMDKLNYKHAKIELEKNLPLENLRTKIKNKKLIKEIYESIKLEGVILKELGMAAKSAWMNKKSKNLFYEKLIYSHELEHSVGKSVIAHLAGSLLETSHEKIDELIYECILEDTLMIYLSTIDINKQKMWKDSLNEILCLLRLKKIIKELEQTNITILIQTIKSKGLDPILRIYDIKQWFINMALNEKIENVTDVFTKIYNIIINKLNWFIKIIGKEIIECLAESEIIFIHEIIQKKKKNKVLEINVNEIIFNINATLPMFISPNYQQNASAYGKTHIYFENQGKKILTKKNINHIHDPFSDIIISSDLLDDLNKAFSTSYMLDYSVIYKYLWYWVKILRTLPENLNEKQILFLSEIYEINFLTLKKNLSEKAYTKLLHECCDFNLSKIMTYEKKKKLKFDYLKKIRNKIYSSKLEIKEILINIIINLRITKFYNKYFIDFRGRNYPLGSFNYLNPKARQFISFFCEKQYMYKNVSNNNNVIELLMQQLYSYFPSQHKNEEKLYNFLINPNKPKISDILYLDYKCGHLFDILKCITDIKGLLFIKHKNYKTSAFCSFYSLDCASSGPQIIAMLLRSKKLAKLVKLYEEENKEEHNEDWYQHIANCVSKEIEFFFIGIKGICDELFNFINNIKFEKLHLYDATIPAKMKKKMKNNYRKQCIILLVEEYFNDFSRILLENVTIRPFLREVIIKMNKITSKDDKLIHKEIFVQLLSSILPNISRKLLYEIASFDLNISNELLIEKIINHIYLNYKKPSIDSLNINNDFNQKLSIIIDKALMSWLLLFYEIFLFIEKGYALFGFNRKMAKPTVMTELYGSTSYGKKYQIIDSTIEQSILNGQIFIDVKTFNILTKYANILPKIIEVYIREIFNKGHQLICFFKNQINHNLFTIKSENITYTYKPYILTSVVKKKFFKKSYRILIRTNQIDYEAINRSFLANFIQHQDAQLVYIFYKLIFDLENSLNKTIPFCVVHDRYFIHPFFASHLKPILKQAYIRFLNEDRYEKHFKDIKELMSLKNKSNEKDYLKMEDLNTTTFVSH